MNNDIQGKTRLRETGFLFALKRVASFLWPIPIKRIKNGEEQLEVVLYCNRKMLNSKHANYSYGNLQTAFSRLFSEVQFDWSQMSSALVLGFGAGGVSKLIQEYNPRIKQVGVERSKEVIKLYETCFERLPFVQVVEADALDYMNRVKGQYDLIVVDVYEDLNVPGQFSTSSFVDQLQNAITKEGVVVYNKVVSNPDQKGEFNALQLYFSESFKQVLVNEQMDINRFLVGKQPK